MFPTGNPFSLAAIKPGDLLRKAKQKLVVATISVNCGFNVILCHHCGWSKSLENFESLWMGNKNQGQKKTLHLPSAGPCQLKGEGSEMGLLWFSRQENMFLWVFFWTTRSGCGK